MSSNWFWWNCYSIKSTIYCQFNEVIDEVEEKNRTKNYYFFRLLLWDCDNRSYSYYIETSYDNIKWSKVIDRQTVACR
jgi:hypothetical protein